MIGAIVLIMGLLVFKIVKDARLNAVQNDENNRKNSVRNKSNNNENTDIVLNQDRENNNSRASIYSIYSSPNFSYYFSHFVPH